MPQPQGTPSGSLANKVAAKGDKELGDKPIKIIARWATAKS